MLYTGNRRNFFLFVSLLLVFAMLLLIATPVKAEPIGIGLTILAAIAFSALSAWGIATVSVNLQGQDLIDYMGGKLQEWANSVGSSINALFPSSGISVNPLGGFILDPIAGTNMSLFAKWFVQQEGITAGSDPVRVLETYGGSWPIYNKTDVQFDGEQIGDIDPELLTCYMGNGFLGKDQYLSNYNENSEETYGVALIAGGYTVLVVSTGQNYIQFINYNRSENKYTLRFGGGREGQKEVNGVTYYAQWVGSVGYNVSNYRTDLTVYNNYEEAINAFAGIAEDAGSLTLQAPGPISIPDDPQNDIVITIPDAIGLDVPDTADKVIQDVVDNELDVDTDTGEGEGEGEGEQEKPEIEWPTLENPVGVTGLEDIFPFCIPFDIYHFFEALAATPETPHFEIPFNIPGIINYTFVIDLSDFNGVAAILRTLETLGFCVGLAFVTRKLIRG